MPFRLLGFVCSAICVFLLQACRDSGALAAVELVKKAAPTSAERPSYRGVRMVETISGDRVSRHRENVFDNGGRDIGLSLVKDPNNTSHTQIQELLFVIHGRFSYQFRDISIGQTEWVAANYLIYLSEDHAMVAGRPTAKLEFVPKHHNAVRVEVRFDEETGLALEVVRFDATNRVNYRMRYDQIEIGNVTRSRNDPPTLPDPPNKLQLSDVPPGTTILSGQSIPAGFVLSERTVTSAQLDTHAKLFVVDRYSDGLQNLFVTQGEFSAMFNNPPAVDSGGGEPVFSVTNLGAINVVWGRREEKSLAAFGPFDRSLLAEVIMGYSRSTK
ncbi:MAG: hypothetical protein ACKVS6_08170 [Planctomycetota bacterium]